MRFDANGGAPKNYEPNSARRPRSRAASPSYAGLDGRRARPAPTPGERHAEDDDFVQAGALYRLMSGEERERLVQNIAGSLSQVSRDDILERALGHFREADAEYGSRVEAAVKALRA